MTSPDLASPEGVRLSPAQRMAWEWAQRGELPLARCLVRVSGSHTAARLFAALERVVARHEILHSAFVHDPRLRFPQRTLDGSRDFQRRMLDLRGQTPERQGAELARLFEASRRAGLDALAPPLDVVLAQLDEADHRAVLTLPALCADAATLRLLVDDWSRELDGAAPRESVVDYAHLAAWQNELEAESDRRMPGGRRLELPFERFDAPSGAQVTVEAALAAPVCRALTELARRAEVSVAALCQAVFAAQLGRLCEEPEPRFALECAGRDFEDVSDLLGPVARWEVVVMKSGRALDGVALRAAQCALEDAAAEDMPLADASLAALDGAIAFAYRDLTAASGVLAIERATVDHPGPRHVLAVHHLSDQLALTLRFDASRLGRPSANLLLAQYGRALEELARASKLPHALDFTSTPRSAGERAPQPEPALLSRAFERHAARAPEELAVVCADGELRYGELERRANQLARRLFAAGLTHGAAVGLWAERSTSTLVGMLAILKAGAAYVPLDPEAPRERLHAQLAAARLTHLVARTPEVAVSGLQVVAVDDPTLATEDAAPLPNAIAGEELASLIFTSGSTGVPKAVAITQGNIASYTRSLLELLAVHTPLHFATVSTLSADLGNTSIFAALASGGTLHVIDYATATDGEAFAEYGARHPLDVLKIVPSHLAALLDAGQGARVLPRKLLITGGEALSPHLRARVEALAPTLALVNHYGPTETTVGALALPVATLEDDRGCSSIPIGRPLAHAEALLLDDTLAPVPVGAPGELYLGGRGVARGYYNRPDLTAERFVPHPFRAGARLYRTGDRARARPDGTIEFLGRRDQQLKIRGFRVELGEIEARLLASPALSAAAVVAKPSAAGGHTLTAYVVPKQDAIDKAALRAFLAEALPDYMIPSELVSLSALPLTKNGKVDRTALAARASESAVRPFREPASELERALAAIWCELLKLPRVGIDDDFFALGGHSLLAIPMLHRIREAVGGALPMSALFEAPTISGLAARLSSREQRGATVLRERGVGAPLFCFDPTGQHAQVYEQVATAVDCPVWALDFPTAALRSATSLDDAAAELAARIRARQPAGPYRLLGWSLGGVLAVATARALEAAGQEVAFCGVVDSVARSDLYDRGELAPFEELASYLSDAQADALLSLPEAERAELARAVVGKSDAARVEAAVNWAITRGFLPADAAPQLYYQRYRLLRSAAIYVAALEDGALACDLTVFWTARTRARHDDRLPRWARITRGREQLQVVDGDHDQALSQPAVLAAIAAATA